MPNRIVGIDIGTDSIKATFAETTFRGFTIVECREIPIPPAQEFSTIELPGADIPIGPPKPDIPADPEADADAEETGVAEDPIEQIPTYVYGLAKLLSAPGVHFNAAAVNFPGKMVSSHLIEVPFTDKKKIDRIIPIEVENHVPFDVDDMVLSYQVVEKGEASSRLLVSLAKKEDVERFLSHLKLAGLDPAILDVGPSALATATYPTCSERNGGQAIIHIGHRSTDVSLFKDGVLIAVRTLGVGYGHLDMDAGPDGFVKLIRPLRQTIQRTVVNYNMPINLIELCGKASLDERLREAIAEGLATQVERFAPFAADFESQVVADETNNATFALSLGLAFRLTPLIKTPQINLRQGQFRHETAGLFLKQELKRFAVMGGILFLLLAYNLVYAHLEGKRQSELLREQITKVFTDTFPGERVVNPVSQFRQNMELVYKKYGLVGYLGNGDLRALDVLRHLSKTIPKTVKIDVKKMDMTQNRLTFDGITNNFEQIDKIEAALKKFDGFKSIKKDSTSRATNEEIKFRFIIKLTEKEETGRLSKRQALMGG
jgi:general secretion pathway protein L